MFRKTQAKIQAVEELKGSLSITKSDGEKWEHGAANVKAFSVQLCQLHSQVAEIMQQCRGNNNGLNKLQRDHAELQTFVGGQNQIVEQIKQHFQEAVNSIQDQKQKIRVLNIEKEKDKKNLMNCSVKEIWIACVL